MSYWIKNEIRTVGQEMRQVKNQYLMKLDEVRARFPEKTLRAVDLAVRKARLVGIPFCQLEI